MVRYVLVRFVHAIPIVLLVTFATYSLLLMLPGDPVTVMFAQGGALTPQQQANLRHQLNLDKPIPVQWMLWVKNAATGDFGRSTQTRLPVSRLLRTSLPVTLQLGMFALVLSLVLAIPAGVLSAVRANSWFDRIATVVAIGGVAMPDFFLAIVLIIIFASRLHWLPATGWVSMGTNAARALKYMLLPGIVVGFALAPLTMRQIRSSLLEVLRQDYVRTARAKGLHEQRIVLVHALRNALLPTLTVFSLVVGRLLAGQVIVEQIFGIPGMGRVFVGAILSRDFPVVQATVLLVALMVIAANLAADICYAMLDPRIRY
jgi:peptide/nickel transport system permease protein